MKKIKMTRDLWNNLPDRVSIYRDPEDSRWGIPSPRTYRKGEGECASSKTDFFYSWSRVLLIIFLPTTLLGIITPWALIGTVPLWVLGIVFHLIYEHRIKIDYYNLYVKSQSPPQLERRELFLNWETDTFNEIKILKSKPLAELTMNQQEWIKSREEYLSYTEAY